MPNFPSNQPLTRQEVAAIFGISYTTFWRKLKLKGIKLESGLLFRPEQEKIFRAFSGEA